MNDRMDQVCSRALLLSPEDTVLLMEVSGPEGALWITPGGRVEPDETLEQALARELHEELGLATVVPERELWIRRAPISLGEREGVEREHIFLVRSPEFEPRPADLGVEEARRFVRFRWWSVEAIEVSDQTFAPRQLGALLRALVRAGPPAHPVETGP